MPFCRLPTSLQFADPTGSPPLVSPQAVSPCLPWNLASLLSNRATVKGRHGESVSTPRYGRSNPSSEVGRFDARNQLCSRERPQKHASSAHSTLTHPLSPLSFSRWVIQHLSSIFFSHFPRFANFRLSTGGKPLQTSTGTFTTITYANLFFTVQWSNPPKIIVRLLVNIEIWKAGFCMRFSVSTATDSVI